VPDWSTLRRTAPITLTREGAPFSMGYGRLCKRLNDWRIRHELHDIPDDVWRFVRDNGFLA
jgi:acyl-CoA dehydrogenase